MSRLQLNPHGSRKIRFAKMTNIFGQLTGPQLTKITVATNLNLSRIAHENGGRGLRNYPTVLRLRI
jgi:hypothetical protein